MEAFVEKTLSASVIFINVVYILVAPAREGYEYRAETVLLCVSHSKSYRVRTLDRGYNALVS